MSKHINQPFKTADRDMAAYLCLKGFTVIGSVEVDETYTNYRGEQEHRKEIILVDQPSREEYVEEWVSRRGEAATCQNFARMIKIVNRALRNG